MWAENNELLEISQEKWGSTLYLNDSITYSAIFPNMDNKYADTQ